MTGPRAASRRNSRALPLPVVLVDERYSSLEAEARLKVARESGQRKRRVAKAMSTRRRPASSWNAGLAKQHEAQCVHNKIAPGACAISSRSTGLSRDALTTILDRAESYRRFPGQPAYEGRELAGVTLANLFFEPSTRTRASFDLASRRLGAHVLNLDVQSSSRAKGETMLDTIYTLEAMNTDVFVIRDSEAGMPEFLIDHVAPHVSVISAARRTSRTRRRDCSTSLTIRSHKRRFAGLKVAIVGDIKHSRVARSTARALRTLGTTDIRLVGPEAALPSEDEFQRSAALHARSRTASPAPTSS
jgi:ornithine carbamoyltransferase